MPVPEQIFLVAESREQPMHVGGLQLFRPPKGSGPEYLQGVYEAVLKQTDVAPLYRKRPFRSAGTLGQWTWQTDDSIDLEHHVRHSALPRPGRIRELLALVSRLHGTPLDRQRPLWEAHLIEGLVDGRFAIYTKLHHALIDGVSANRSLQRVLSPDPDLRDVPPPWVARPSRKRSKGNTSGGVLALPGAALHTASDIVGFGPALLKRAYNQAINQQMATLPGMAPRSVLNVPISGARRFAAQSWPLERFRAVAKASNGTLNDVILAVCAGALRRYLLELDSLPSSPLVAMTPVSLREEDEDDDAAGVSVGTILCNLATTTEDPVERLNLIHASMQAGKDTFRGLSQLQATALSAAVVLPLALDAFVDTHGLTRPAYNLVISNVPGPKDQLYFNGASLEGMYPLSIPTNGQALNITVNSYNGSFEFGLVGDRRAVPRLQRLLGHLDTSLNELVEAVGA